MSTINEVKEEMGVVNAVGDFANALQQIAAMRMMLARKKVLAGRKFVDTAEKVLKELKSVQAIQNLKDIEEIEKHSKSTKLKAKEDFKAVIVITSDQGLNGGYNYEIFKKIQQVMDNKDGLYDGFNAADFFILGKKGQEYFRLGKIKAKYFPYNIPENFEMKDLQRLIKLFNHYNNILLIYSKYVNTTTRDVRVMSLAAPPEIIIKDTNIYKDKKSHPQEQPKSKEVKQVGFSGKDIKFIFEPTLDQLILDVSEKLRAAVIRQEILDGRLSHYSAQMVGMKAASDNAIELNGDLKKEYNKQRRKQIDKKIGEVFAGINLW